MTATIPAEDTWLNLDTAKAILQLSPLAVTELGLTGFLATRQAAGETVYGATSVLEMAYRRGTLTRPGEDTE